MRKLSVLAVLFLIALSALAQTQATTGVIEGIVTDESGAVLPGVTISVRNTATNREVTVVTDQDGRFRVPLLPLGPYRVTSFLSGFATTIREGIELSLGQSVNVAVQLRPSALAENIVVTAAAPVVETTRTAGSTRIDQKAVEGLPNNGRNFLEYTKLTPGVTIVQGPDGDELSINGQKGIHNNVSVDGADFNNPFFGEQRGGQRPPFTFNLDAVQEVVVVADGANAEFGRSSSGFVNVITKSGTNQMRGTAHAYWKDDSFSANPKRADGSEGSDFNFEQQQVGLTLGGPIREDQLFYFVALDLQDGTSEKQTDPARIEQRVVDYFASIGSPNENAAIDRTNDARVALGKLDWQATLQHLATLRYSYTWSEQVNGTFDVDSWGRSANAIEQDWSNAVTGTLISSISSNLLNEFRFQWAREDRPRPYNGPNISGQNRPIPDTAFDFGRGYRFGMPFFIPVEYYDTREQFTNNVSWLRGRHAFKAGAEWNRVVSSQTFLGFANGRWIFSSTDGFLNYAQNPNYVECSNGSTSQTGTCPGGATITGPVLFYLQQAGVGGRTVEDAGTQSIAQEEPAVFIQDTWQPLNNLTVDYGLRWEAQIQPDPRTPPDEVFFAPFIGQTRNGQEFPSDGTIPSDKEMLQPRLAVSWDPTNDGRNVIRANVGVYYARVPGLNIASSRSTNGSIGQGVFRNSFLAGIGVLPPVPAYPNLIPQSEIGSPFQPTVYVFDKDFRNPRTTAAAIGYERAVGPNMALLVKYNYAKGDHLTRFANRNDPLLGCPWGTGLAPGGVNGVGCGDGILPDGLMTVESTAKSLYQGITLGLNRRLATNYQWQAYYTYSKDKSDDDNERDPFTLRYAKITDLDPEYSLSDRDQKHRFNSWFLWNAPYAIDVNVRYSYRSAQPKSIKADGTDANAPVDRRNPDGTVTPRNLGRKDNEFSSLDLRLTRDFALGGVTVQPILDVFNLTNSKNLRKPETTNLVFNFDGTVQSGSGDPRQAQFGVRVVW
jgi:outer membrane receptor for ferrienterochelin and colicin